MYASCGVATGTEGYGEGRKESAWLDGGACSIVHSSPLINGFSTTSLLGPETTEYRIY